MNKVEEIVFTKNKKDKEKKNKELTKLLANNPAEKDNLLKEFQQALDNSGIRIEAIKEQIDLKIKLKEVAEIISISYIAKTYFNRTRQWLYQRINGNLVAGKKRELTEEQRNTLNFALKDISKKIGSLSV